MHSKTTLAPSDGKPRILVYKTLFIWNSFINIHTYSSVLFSSKIVLMASPNLTPLPSSWCSFSKLKYNVVISVTL